MSPTARTHRPTELRGASTTGRAGTTVLVIAARGDSCGATAAENFAVRLRDTAPATTPVVATHAGAPDLAAHVATAQRVYVLDPGRVRAWRERLRARSTGHEHSLTAPARVADRLALLRLLRDHQSRVQWIARPTQLPRSCSRRAAAAQ